MKQRAGGGRLGRCAGVTAAARPRFFKGKEGVTSVGVNVVVVVAVHLTGLDSAVLQQLDEQQAAGDQGSRRCLLNFTGSLQWV